MNKSILAVVVVLMIWLPGTSPTAAQEIVPFIKAVKNPRPSAGSRRPAATGGVRRVTERVRIKTETVRVRVSNLAITTTPGATVTLSSAARTVKIDKPIQTADEDGNVIFDELMPGTYKVEASKDGFETVENPDVRISPQNAHVLDMDLKPITYKLKIGTNLRSGGEVYYAKPDKAATGSAASARPGNYCVVALQPNGEAIIPDLTKGYYFIYVRPGPDALEFEELRTAVNVPDDIDGETETGGLETYQLELEKKISTETFNPTAWVPSDWVLPADWRIERGMKVMSQGIALPQNERYRHYIKFELIVNVKLPETGTAGFVLRASDNKNYYVLQISGARAPQPNAATLYYVKDGVPQPAIKSLTTAAFASTIASPTGFRVFVRNEKEEEFMLEIEDLDKGTKFPVGQFEDPYGRSKKGAVGIASPAKSNFEINFFQVCAPRCE